LPAGRANAILKSEKEITIMHVTKESIPAKINVPGATARQVADFGDATGAKGMAGEYFSLAAGLDIAPLLKGLKDDSCQAPHWGYVIAGEVVVTYSDGTTERCATNDLFFWPAGHSVRGVDDAELVLFSPEREHTAVMDHMLEAMKKG
jgi:hypothetical protein